MSLGITRLLKSKTTGLYIWGIFAVEQSEEENRILKRGEKE